MCTCKTHLKMVCIKYMVCFNATQNNVITWILDNYNAPKPPEVIKKVTFEINKKVVSGVRADIRLVKTGITGA